MRQTTSRGLLILLELHVVVFFLYLVDLMDFTATCI